MDNLLPTWFHIDDMHHPYVRPYSNECGPRTILTLAVLSAHKQPYMNILKPQITPNLAQCSRTWMGMLLLSGRVDLLFTGESDYQYSPTTIIRLLASSFINWDPTPSLSPSEPSSLPFTVQCTQNVNTALLPKQRGSIRNHNLINVSFQISEEDQPKIAFCSLWDIYTRWHANSNHQMDMPSSFHP